MLNRIILTSLFRNFFTDLRKASVDIPKPRFASSISQSANDFFLHFLFKKKLGEGTSMRRSKVTLLFSLTCSVDFFIMLSPYKPYNKPAFLALIPPSLTSHAKQAAHTKSSRLRMSEKNFRTELSRITFYDYIIYHKLSL